MARRKWQEENRFRKPCPRPESGASPFDTTSSSHPGAVFPRNRPTPIAVRCQQSVPEKQAPLTAARVTPYKRPAHKPRLKILHKSRTLPQDAGRANSGWPSPCLLANTWKDWNHLEDPPGKCASSLRA